MTLRRVLVVAGSDSGGGAGIQADIKTVGAMGAYAATAITAVTAQDTTGVHAVHPIPAAIVRRQMEAVLDDLGADAVKTGMLGDAELVDTVADVLRARAGALPVVVDPVMVAKGGAPLLPDDAVSALRSRLVKLSTVLTPNLPEAAVLAGFPVGDLRSMREAARSLLGLGAGAVLLKGGHLPGEEVVDLLLLAADAEPIEFRDRRIASRHTHGTGCTLASAVASGLAQGLTIADAVRRARRYVRHAIEAAPGFGRGHGPLNHLVADPGIGASD